MNSDPKFLQRASGHSVSKLLGLCDSGHCSLTSFLCISFFLLHISSHLVCFLWNQKPKLIKQIAYYKSNLYVLQKIVSDSQKEIIHTTTNNTINDRLLNNHQSFFLFTVCVYVSHICTHLYLERNTHIYQGVQSMTKKSKWVSPSVLGSSANTVSTRILRLNSGPN